MARGRVGKGVTLRRRFFDRPTRDVARDLLGKVLVCRSGVRARAGGVVTSGVIVEVEAYIGESDPACHAAAGPTRRNAPLYGPPGFCYVYLNYGIHRLVNVVTEAEGFPAAVLIRALDPLEGIDTMRRRRARATRRRSGLREAHALCRGPGNLTVSMGITLADNGADLTARRVCIEDRGIVVGAVKWGPRIGITVGTRRAWRAWVANHPAVSGPKGR